MKRDSPNYLFLKQSASLHSYFGELCLDVPLPDETAAVFSEIDTQQRGNIAFYPSPGYRRRSSAARVLSWIAYFGAAMRFSFEVKGRPLLFIVAQPPFLPLLGYAQKKLLGRSYVVWIDDIYPDVLVRKRIIRNDGWVARLWSGMNRITLRHAQHVFTICPQMLTTIRQYLDAGAAATVVPTWVDTDGIYPIPKQENAWAREHGLADRFVVMYSGNFGETHDVEVLVEAARQLRERTDLCFVLIGAGAKWESIRRSVAGQRDSNILLLPWQPAEVLTQSLASAEVAFVSLGEVIEGISMPSKTYYAMSAGSAILASCGEHSDLGVLVKSAACGVTVRPGSIRDLVAAIEHLSSDPRRLATYQSNSRATAVGYYSRRTNVQLIRQALGAASGEYAKDTNTQFSFPPNATTRHNPKAH